jgi:dolichol-phosphate mannosyltransferase
MLTAEPALVFEIPNKHTLSTLRGVAKMRGAMSRVCVTLPTYNEAGSIEEVLRRLRAALPAATLLVIDDGSPDGTADISERCGQGLGRTTILRRAGKLGLGSAYRFGLAWADDHDHQIAVAMDSDLSPSRRSET